MKTDLLQMRSLCEEIDLPDEVTGQILQIAADGDFSGIEGYVNKLFSLETGDEAYEKIVSVLKENERSLKPLAIYVSAALTTWEMYQKRDIPRFIYIDTMKMFSRFVREHFETHGFYGFDRDFWIHRILSVSLFRLGTLEFEMTKCTDNVVLDYAPNGEKIISVHIPSDASMTRENLNKSYEMAYQFFADYFPEYKNKIIYCKTWLLDPALKELLPAGSKILEFQSDYKIIQTTLEESEFISWVFKKNYDDYTLLPENTSLQRNMKKYLLAGDRISLATGIKKRNIV
jgi:hypothetical protein